METTLRVRNISFAELEARMGEVLAEVDRGEYDADLQRAGVRRDPSVRLEGAVTISTGQGLSPDQWAEVLVAFAPFAGEVAKSIWEIVVVPALKRVFREDRVKGDGEA